MNMQGRICSLLASDPGNREVRIYLEKENLRLRAPECYNTAGSEETIKALKDLLGIKNVV